MNAKVQPLAQVEHVMLGAVTVKPMVRGHHARTDKVKAKAPVQQRMAINYLDARNSLLRSGAHLPTMAAGI